MFRHAIAVAALALVLSACGTEEFPLTPCSTDSECATGYACVGDGATGYCGTSCYNDGCEDGYGCPAEGGFTCVEGGVEPPPPTSNACEGLSCGAYACLTTDGAEMCATTCVDGCAAGFACGGTTGTECVEAVVTCADLTCGSYACDEAAGACFTSCVDGAECAEGAQCDDLESGGVCVEASTDYQWVAILSRAEGEAALANVNPGPDFDFVSVSAGGFETAPGAVVSSAEGPAMEENLRSLAAYADAVLLQDTVVDGFCDLDAQPGYVSIGGYGGFIIVRFDRPIVTGDAITVYEIDSNYCDDAATERPDTYEVYIGADESMALAPGSAQDIQANWCLVGAQGGNGGVGQFTFNSDNCGM